MKQHQQLTQDDRIEIYAMKQSGKPQRTIAQRLYPHRRRIHTITTDNGREFADHQTIADKLQAKFYFAQPYQAW